MLNLLSRGSRIYHSGGWKALRSVGIRHVLKSDPRTNDLDPRSDDLRSHIRYLNDMRNITVAEIGVWEGNHARILQEQLDIDEIYLIDPYDAYEDYEENKSEVEKMRDAEQEAHKKLKKYDNIEWIKEYSHVASEQIDTELDYVYVDGNHKYEYVKRDIEEYYKKLKPGGVIAGHDFCLPWTGVIEAVTEFSEQKDIEYHIENYGSDWYMKK